MSTAEGMQVERTEVLVVGGGGAGLTASMLLTELGIAHLLVNSRRGTSDLPKAHVLGQRTMEILDGLGAAEEITRRGTPAANMTATAFYAGFAGGGENDGRRIARLECWGAGGENEHWRTASPWLQHDLPQIRLEPILRRRAEELSPGRVRFHQELTGLSQDEQGVSAQIRDHAGGRDYEVRCAYLIGADGGRRVAGEIGVEYEGLGVVAQTATLHVSADFSRWARDPDVLIRWILSPLAGVGVVMVPMGPERWGPDSEEWVLHLTSPAIDPHTQSDEQLIATARAAMGIGEHPLEVHKLTRWPVDALIASAFGAGRVYLVGDAAHRHPPTGGLGLNSAVHDSFNLCWKLASVLRGDAGPELLESYEAERRPCDELNAQRSLENAVNHYVIAAAAGVTFEQTEEQNLANLARLFSGAQEDAEHRSAVLRGMRAQSMEFDEHNVEIGHLYSSTAVLPDTSDAPASPDAVRVHAPDARPGSPLPHAWIEDEDGNRTALRELVRPGRFLLIAGEDGEAWCDAARALAATGAPVDAVRIGHLDGDLFDPRSTWARTRGFGPQGAALVRPDRVVAWRRSDAGEHPREALGAALGAILSTPHTHVTTNA